MSQRKVANLLLLFPIIIAAHVERDAITTSSIIRDRFRKGEGTTNNYQASSYNDTIDTRSFSGSRDHGANAKSADIGADVAASQIDADRSIQDEQALWQKTARYNAYLEANHLRKDVEGGERFQTNDVELTTDRARTGRGLIEHRYSDILEFDDATRQQNKTGSDFGSSKERYRAERLDEKAKSQAVITPFASSNYDYIAQNAALDEASVDTKTRWNILQKERAIGHAFDDRLRYSLEAAELAV